MCGRYGFSLNNREAAAILRAVAALEGAEAAESLRRGEVFPTDRVPVLLAGNGRVLPVSARWGLSSQDKKVLINARAETVLQKSRFRSLMNRRCIVPTTGFYEWDPERRKGLFTARSSMTWLAGLWEWEGEERRFVILTTAANAAMASVHDRMPLVLTEEQGLDWLYDRKKAEALLSLQPEMLQADFSGAGQSGSSPV